MMIRNRLLVVAAAALAAATALVGATPAAAQEDLSSYLDLPLEAGTREAALAALERARAALRAGDGAAALAAYDEARVAAPHFGDWLHLLSAEAAAASADTAAVTRHLAAAGAAIASEWGWRYLVDARLAAGDTAGAIREASAAATRLAGAARRAAATFREAELRLARGDTAAVRPLLRRIMQGSPGTVAAVDAARTLTAVGAEGPEDHLLIGQIYLRHGNVDRGVAGVEAYLAAGRGTPAERASLRLEVGRALFNAGRHQAAEERLVALASEPVARSVAAEALFLTARSRYRAGRTAEGLATFRQVIERYPDQPVAGVAAYMVADLEQDDGRVAEARHLFRQSMELQPTALEAGLSAMRLGGLAFLEGDYRGALEIYEGYLARFPQGRRAQQAAYWAALAHRRLGDEERAQERLRQARQMDPFSYYGVLAAELLGLPALDLPLAPAPASAAEPTAQARVAAFRVELLRAFGPADAPAFELDRLRRYFDGRPNGWYVLAEALNESGSAYDGILLGREIESREGRLNLRLLRIIYPVPYRDLILPLARQYGVDPFLVAGLIRQESMYSPAIVSPAGAIGLMQVMPSTGTTLAAELGLAGFDPERDLRRPEVNLRLGIHYLAKRLEQYGGDVVSALAAYNAGAHRVEFWSTFPEYRDPQLFAERIPFAETRDYVKIVQANARIYRALYE